MQLTLVSHYGSKTPAFAALISELQTRLGEESGTSFSPYELAQIHGTIVGLEGRLVGGQVCNENWLRCRQQEQPMDFAGLTAAARTIKPFKVRVGGFLANSPMNFVSNGQHPYERSFSIQSEIAVAMGWPWENDGASEQLVNFRKSLERCGVLHKWHRNEADRDNDFFFVLGRIDRTIAAPAKAHLESKLRRMLAARRPLELEVSSDTLAFIAYEDPRLPLSTSRAFPVNEPALTADLLRQMY